MKNKFLSIKGFENYYLTPDGRLFKTAPTEQEIKKNSRNKFVLISENGNKKVISLKRLYRKVFEKEFCIDNIEDLKDEEWKPIADTKGKYFISNCGRIKSYCGYNAILLKPYFNSNGYLQVKINYKNVKIHQIVAFSFCQNDFKGMKTEVHHINKNRIDNKADNLIILSVEEHHKIHNKKDKKENE